MELLMLNDTFGADRALELGMINAVVDDEKLQEEANTWLDRLMHGPTRALGGIKKLVMRAHANDINAHLGLEHTYHGQTSRTFDFREGVKAVLDGKPPKFTGA
jgi:2-(1,2-epoxy-1,2-dihydrophenyl)acetyl-CoA isomerase